MSWLDDFHELNDSLLLEIFSKPTLSNLYIILKYDLDIHIDFVKTHSNFISDLTRVLSHPDFSIEWIKDCPSGNWDFSKLMNHPKFNINWIKDFPSGNWDYSKLMNHPEV